MLDLQDFAYAAASRYNGQHVDASGATLPKVNRWEAWNEPNLASHLLPQWTAIGTKKIVGDPFCFGKTWIPSSPTIYRGILNAIYRGVHAAGTAASIQESVAGGATAPYGKGPCATVPGFAPLAFLRDLVKKPVSLDVWSHHPYRNHAPERGAVQGRQRRRAGHAAPVRGPQQGVPGPQDPGLGDGVRRTDEPARQVAGRDARTAGRATLKSAYTAFKKSGRVKMLVWFLVRDEDIDGRPFGAGFQSGPRVLQRQAEAGVQRLQVARGVELAARAGRRGALRPARA